MELLDTESIEASILWSQHEETKDLPGERVLSTSCLWILHLVQRFRLIAPRFFTGSISSHPSVIQRPYGPEYGKNECPGVATDLILTQWPPPPIWPSVHYTGQVVRGRISQFRNYFWFCKSTSALTTPTFWREFSYYRKHFRTFWTISSTFESTSSFWILLLLHTPQI